VPRRAHPPAPAHGQAGPMAPQICRLNLSPPARLRGKLKVVVAVTAPDQNRTASNCFFVLTKHVIKWLGIAGIMPLI
jgi:hypothetical protein